jgi:hypothetical protein
MMKGNKRDNTPWLDPTTPVQRATKFVFPGDPETNSGWTQEDGIVNNCFGELSGNIIPNPSNAAIFLMSTGNTDYTILKNNEHTLYYAQLTARGTSNKNSVTRLKILSDKAQNFFTNGFVIGINPVSASVPDKFYLYQNYPNPFNPETKIKFEIPQSDFINLTVYAINGRIVEKLVGEKLLAGTYEINFTSENLSSGIYFYQIKTSTFSETKE